MKVFSNPTLLVVVCGLVPLGACGGGAGGGTTVSTPPPLLTPAPTPTPPPVAAGGADRIIAGATTTQTFASRGPQSGGPHPLEFYYDSVTGTYSVAPPSTAPGKTVDRDTSYQPLPGEPWKAFKAAFESNLIFEFQIRASADDATSKYRYTYSNLATWSYHVENQGPGATATTAFGIPTPASAVPRAGVGTYEGFLEGYVSEKYFDNLAGAQLPGSVTGSLNLTFDFTAGTMTGAMDTTLGLDQYYSLGALKFDNMAWGVGSPQFTGYLTGQNITNGVTNGLFTGPSAQELIGGFGFNYLSPATGSAQSAAGAYIAKQGP